MEYSTNLYEGEFKKKQIYMYLQTTSRSLLIRLNTEFKQPSQCKADPKNQEMNQSFTVYNFLF
jgi:hypothetical protein